MNILKSTQKTLFAVALMSLSLVGFTSCSDDDDDNNDKPNNEQLESEMGVFGSYKGTYEIIDPATKAEGEGEGETEEPQPTYVNMVVELNHDIKMEAYPLNEVIADLYETEDEANAVLEELGDINTEFKFESKDINKEEGTLSLEIDTKDIEKTLKNGDIIKIDFDTNDQLGKFNNKDEGTKIAFNLDVKVELFKAAVTPEEPVEPETTIRESEVESTKTAQASQSFTFNKVTK